MFDRLFVIPCLREAGFHLPMGSDGFGPERTRGGGLRVLWPENDSLSVTPNGLATAVEGQEHLTWAYRNVARESEIWINPLALVEFTLEFWRFYVSHVHARLAEPGRIKWRAGMNSLTSPEPLFLPSRFVQRSPKDHADSDDIQLDWSTTDESDPERLAFDVLVEVYAHFGFDEEIIPWAENRRVSEQLILDIKRGQAS